MRSRQTPSGLAIGRTCLPIRGYGSQVSQGMPHSAMSSGHRRNPRRGCPGHRNNGSITPGRGSGGNTPYCDRPSPRQCEIVGPGAARARNRERQPPSLKQGGEHRSEGSDVGCSHAVGCPLFPLLRASLKGWRDYYCDSEDQWLGCARYQVSLTGERVPISLLPNGASARHLEAAAGEAARSAAANPEQEPQQSPLPQHNPWSPESASWSQPAPARPPESSEPLTATSQTAAQFGTAPAPTPVSHDQPSPSPRSPQPQYHASRHARQGSRSKRGWWARFTEWMGGPA